MQLIIVIVTVIEKCEERKINDLERFISYIEWFIRNHFFFTVIVYLHFAIYIFYHCNNKTILQKWLIIEKLYYKYFRQYFTTILEFELPLLFNDTSLKNRLDFKSFSVIIEK